MAKQAEIWRCRECGAQSSRWLGQCPSCRAWNTLEGMRPSSPGRNVGGDGPVLLADVAEHGHTPYTSGLAALDRALGSGIVPGAAILVGGEPGIGKSTLLLQVAGNVAAEGRKVLYASGEEGLGQIRGRGERLGVLGPNLLAMSTNSVEEVVAALEKAGVELLVVDSVQTMTSAAAEGLPGNVNQVRAVATTLVEACRKQNCALVLVGHVTKEGVLAGPRLLEHMVDTVMSLEGDRRQMFRLLRIYKNRFGPNDDLLVFRMAQQGMEVVADPSTFFLSARDADLSGSALAMAVDGHRPLVVEVQSLVTRSWLSIPRRTALGFDVNRLNLLLAVLEKRLNLNFGQVDIYAKVGGGIRLQEPGIDLAIVAAVLSSYYDQAIGEKHIFWGEIDLNGQIRPVSGHEIRLRQALKLGFAPFHAPDEATSGVADIRTLQKKLFSRKDGNRT